MGLVIILAALVVIALITGLLFHYQQTTREAQIRSQGVGLARVLSGMPLNQLVPLRRGQGMLQVIYQNWQKSSLAYAAIVDTSGVELDAVAAPGVIIPHAAIATEPSAWLGEREITLGAGQQQVLEFYAPILDQGALVAVVKVAYFKPGYGLTVQQIPFFASIALPIFLLAPFFYFLLRREIKPLHQVQEQMASIYQNGQLAKVDVQASGELGEFMQNLNGFINHAQTRIEELESNQSSLAASTKLISYQRARVETVLQAIPDGVIVLDESGQTSFVNAKVANLLGIAEESIVQGQIREWCTEPQVLAFLSKAENAKTGRYSLDSIEFTPANASEKTLRVNAYPLFSPKNVSSVFGTLIVFRDVSLEMLAKSSRGEFVAHVAHELKTPLNVLAMYSESLLGEDGRDESFRVEAVNIIHDEVERLSTLINNMLSITKIEMGSLDINKQRIRLTDLLKDAFENISRSDHKHNLKFELDIPNEMSAVFVDKDLLRVALNNLLTNAIKYNRPDGVVTLSAEEDEQMLRICVRDTGLGIDPNDQEKIFDKFYRSKEDTVRQQTGHGLGLSLARDIVQLHNATLSVSSVVGEGTEFTIEFQKSTGLVKQAI